MNEWKSCQAAKKFTGRKTPWKKSYDQLFQDRIVEVSDAPKCNAAPKCSQLQLSSQKASSRIFPALRQAFSQLD